MLVFARDFPNHFFTLRLKSAYLYAIIEPYTEVHLHAEGEKLHYERERVTSPYRAYLPWRIGRNPPSLHTKRAY